MGFYTLSVAVLVVAAALLATLSQNKGTGNVALALVLSLFAAVLCGQVFHNYLYLIPVIAVCVLLTSRWDSGLAHVVSVLYGFRVLLVPFEHYGLIPLWLYEEVNSWFVIVQAGVVIWGSVRHGGIGNYRVYGRVNRLFHMVLPTTAKVVQKSEKRSHEDVKKTH